MERPPSGDASATRRDGGNPATCLPGGPVCAHVDAGKTGSVQSDLVTYEQHNGADALPK
jgi:hypothetical protein